MRLDKLRSTQKAFPDLLNFSHAVAPGIVMGKDGSLTAGWAYRGEDLDSTTNEELNSLAARLNNKYKILGNGWTLFVDCIRASSSDYPSHDSLHFPDSITKLIDEERRALYTRTQAHIQSEYVISLTYLPPSLAESKLEELMYEGDKTKKSRSIADKLLSEFNDWADEFSDSLRDVLLIDRLTAYEHHTESGHVIHRDALVNYLAWCVTGEHIELNLSEEIPYLDGIIGNRDFISGLDPVVGDKHIAVVAITGFPQETMPGMLQALDSYPLEYRWSTRFIYMDTEEAKNEINRFRRRWKQKERGFLDQVLKTNRSAADQDAMRMSSETEAAIADVSSQLVTYGFYTSNVILMNENKEMLTEAAKNMVRSIKAIGFDARIETINAVEAFLGSIPAHVSFNIRRPIMHTMNLVDLLPMSAIWCGREHNPCDKYPAFSPALLYCDTTGATTFRLNLHVSDLGHTLVFGPTSSGKSTLLALLAAQFRKYASAQFYSFDKGYSMYALTKAIGAPHYDIAGDDSTLQFCPLANLDSPMKINWAEDWVRTCCELQMASKLTPAHKAEIHQAMNLHVKNKSTTLTEFVSNLQIQELREALTHYTVEGPMGHLLDSEEDNLALADFVCFEMEYLMNYSDEDKLPVLLYIFHRIEISLNGQPSMIMLDEAWVMLGHPVFREKIREWLKVLRKNNCVVLMATQSLSDALNSGIMDVLIESCPTKIYLPNGAAKSDVSRPFYEQVGLNRAQIDLLSQAVPKRQYYVNSSEGNRLFELALGDISLSFVAQSGKESKQIIDGYISRHGGQWPHHWLTDRGINYQTLLEES